MHLRASTERQPRNLNKKKRKTIDKTGLQNPTTDLSIVDKQTAAVGMDGRNLRKTPNLANIAFNMTEYFL